MKSNPQAEFSSADNQSNVGQFSCIPYFYESQVCPDFAKTFSGWASYSNKNYFDAKITEIIKEEYDILTFH